MKNYKITILGLLVSLTAFGVALELTIKFVADSNDQGKTGYLAHPDFQLVEDEQPLTLEDRESVQPSDFEGMSQEQISQIYACLKSGPIPNGRFEGKVIFANGGFINFAKAMAGAENPVLAALITNDRVESMAEGLWAGKEFFKTQGRLRNMIPMTDKNKKTLSTLTGVEEERFDNDPKITKVNFHREGDEDVPAALLMPAKLYCGQSLLDSRKESIIIDYAFADDFKDIYYPEIDDVAGRDGLKIRDEIRMIRPGFYLGIAYLDKIPVLNFLLYDRLSMNDSFTQEDLDANECLSGDQASAN